MCTSVAEHKGQACYICTQALHWKTKEGSCWCSCRGTASLRTCRAWRAGEDFMRGGEENNLGVKALAEGGRGGACSLCEQHYHGVVRCALGWACFKAYLGRPETVG